VTITTELVLVRHGQALCEVGGIVGGRLGCTGLTPTGRRQTHQLALRLAAEHDRRAFAALYTSPRARAVQAAAQLSAVLTLPVTTVEELREPDPGKGDNRPWREVITAFDGPPQHRPTSPGRPVPNPGTCSSNGPPAP
jgi:probable phosphoglycerate mutase